MNFYLHILFLSSMWFSCIIIMKLIKIIKFYQHVLYYQVCDSFYYHHLYQHISSQSRYHHLRSCNNAVFRTTVRLQIVSLWRRNGLETKTKEDGKNNTSLFFEKHTEIMQKQIHTYFVSAIISLLVINTLEISLYIFIRLFILLFWQPLLKALMILLAYFSFFFFFLAQHNIT